MFTFVSTLFKDDGEAINEDGLRRVLEHRFRNWVGRVYVFGSTDGNGSFSEEEIKRGIEIEARHVEGRIAVIA